MFIAAQQRNSNEVPELLKWEVALPPPTLTIPTTGAVKFATKASVVESLVSFTEKHSSNNDAIFMDRGVTTVIIDASVLIRKQRPKNSHGSFEGYAMFLKDLIEVQFEICTIMGSQGWAWLVVGDCTTLGMVQCGGLQFLPLWGRGLGIAGFYNFSEFGVLYHYGG